MTLPSKFKPQMLVSSNGWSIKQEFFRSYQKDFIINFEVNSISTSGRGEKENEKL